MPDVILTESEQQRLEQEQQTLVRTLIERGRNAERAMGAQIVTATPAKGTTALSAIAAKLAAPANEAAQQSADAGRSEVQKLVGDKIIRARSAEAKLGILRSRHLDRAVEVAGLPFGKLRAALQYDFVESSTERIEPGALMAFEAAAPTLAAAGVDFDKLRDQLPRQRTPGQMVSPSRDTLAALEETAKALVAVLQTTFGDSHRDPKDIDPVSLADCARTVESHAQGGRLTPELRRYIGQLQWWLDRAEAAVTSAEALTARFTATLAKAEAILSEVVPLAAAMPEPEKFMVPRSEPLPPAPNASSYVGDLDVREPNYGQGQPADDGVKVVALPNGTRITTSRRKA